ncbi:hypothetical protein Angca_002873, partial [Angiostrongylus cantonensis]
DDKERLGRLYELDEGNLKALLEANMRTTVREPAEQLGVSTRATCTHFNRIGKTK